MSLEYRRVCRERRVTFTVHARQTVFRGNHLGWVTFWVRQRVYDSMGNRILMRRDRPFATLCTTLGARGPIQKPPSCKRNTVRSVP